MPRLSLGTVIPFVAVGNLSTRPMDNADQRPASGVRNQAVNQWVAPPRELPGFPDAERAKPKTRFGGGLRKRWVDSHGLIYEWDYQHGTVEVYDSRGGHIGEYNPMTGVRIKAADPRKQVDP